MKWLIPCSLLLSFGLVHAEQNPVSVAQFSKGDLQGWEEESFVGHSQYKITDTQNGKVLKAYSAKTASGLFKKLEIDLTKTPYLNWSWRVENTFRNNNEQSKPGDDYPARIYVVIDGGFFFWKTKALNYVWSSNQATETSWPNAFTSNAQMLAVRTGEEQLGTWVSEKRNVIEDLKRLFGEDFKKIDAVAIMTDSDNTEQSATAYYGDIYFSAK